VTKKDSYPLSRIDDIFDQLSGNVWYSTLDLKSRYWQIKIYRKGMLHANADGYPGDHVQVPNVDIALELKRRKRLNKKSLSHEFLTQNNLINWRQD